MGEERLTDHHRRVLTELIGECWHERTDDVTQDGNWCICVCGYAFIKPENHVNRTFDTWEDYGRVIEEIKERGLYEDFYYYCTQVCNRMFRPWEFNHWMQDPARCLEIAEFILNRKEKG